MGVLADVANEHESSSSVVSNRIMGRNTRAFEPWGVRPKIGLHIQTKGVKITNHKRGERGEERMNASPSFHWQGGERFF